MKKTYEVEILNHGEYIDGYHQCNVNISIDSDDFNEMLLLVASLNHMKTAAKFNLDEQGKDDNGLTIRVFADDEVVFESIAALETYMMKHKVEAWLDYGNETYITVNSIRYHGKVVAGMIPKEHKPYVIKKDINLRKGTVITTYCDIFHTVHQYILVKDANIEERPYRLVGISGGYTIQAGFNATNPNDAIHYLEALGLSIVSIEDPGKYHVNK